MVSAPSAPSSDAIIIRGNGHAPIYVSSEDSIRFDFGDDGSTDYYIKAHYTGNENQMYKVDIKIEESCVDGSTYEDATMKLGFTNLEGDHTKRTWLTDEFTVWNPWFRSARSTDINNEIDLVSLPLGAIPIPYPESGDDLIQRNPDDKQGSFRHVKSIKELDNRAGWEGSFFFNTVEGSYFIWLIFPAGGSPNGEQCDGVAAFGTSSTIVQRHNVS